MNSKGLNISCQRSALPFLAATLLFGLQAANAASYSDTVQADNPIAYYRLAETDGTTAADSSSSGLYPGTYNVSGAYPLLGQPGIDTNSIGLSAAQTASVTAGYYAELNPQGPFSFEVWARPTSTPGSGVYRCPIGNFGGWGTGNGYGTGWYVYQAVRQHVCVHHGAFGRLDYRALYACSNGITWLAPSMARVRLSTSMAR